MRRTSSLCCGDEVAATQGVRSDRGGEKRRRRAEVDTRRGDVQRGDGDEVPMHTGARRRRGAEIPPQTGIVRQLDGRRGNRPESGDPAPLGRLCVDAGMSMTAQCQNPDPVGASGSNTVTTKLLVAAGKPVQVSCGELSLPPGTPPRSESCSTGMGLPSTTSLLLTRNRGTFGRPRYGSTAGGVALAVGAAADGPVGRVGALALHATRLAMKSISSGTPRIVARGCPRRPAGREQRARVVNMSRL